MQQCINTQCNRYTVQKSLMPNNAFKGECKLVHGTRVEWPWAFAFLTVAHHLPTSSREGGVSCTSSQPTTCLQPYFLLWPWNTQINKYLQKYTTRTRHKFSSSRHNHLQPYFLLMPHHFSLFSSFILWIKAFFFLSKLVSSLGSNCFHQVLQKLDILSAILPPLMLWVFPLKKSHNWVFFLCN